MKNFLTLLGLVLALVGALFVKIAAVPPLTVAICLLCVLLFAALLVTSDRWKKATRMFSAGQLRIGLFALIVFSSTLSIFAADFVERKITSLIMYPGVRAESDTNGFIRLYYNSSNYYSISTNTKPIAYIGSGVYTGFTGIILTGGTATQLVVNGVIVGTNVTSAQPIPVQ